MWFYHAMPHKEPLQSQLDPTKFARLFKILVEIAEWWFNYILVLSKDIEIVEKYIEVMELKVYE